MFIFVVIYIISCVLLLSIIIMQNVDRKEDDDEIVLKWNSIAFILLSFVPGINVIALIEVVRVMVSNDEYSGVSLIKTRDGIEIKLKRK